MVAEFTLNKRHRDVVQAIARLNRSDIHVAFSQEDRIAPKSKLKPLNLASTK
jgi:hypothetical protein